jgi:hypothetical protein
MIKLKSYKTVLDSCQLQVLLSVVYFNWYLIFTWLQSKLTSILSSISFACTNFSSFEFDLLTILSEAEKKLLNLLNVINFIDCVLKLFNLPNELSFLSNISKVVKDFLSTSIKEMFALIRDKIGSDQNLIKIEKELCMEFLKYEAIDSITSFFIYILYVINYVLLGLLILAVLYGFVDWSSSSKKVIKTNLIHLYLPRYTFIMALVFVAKYVIFYYCLNWIQSDITNWVIELISIGLDASLFILKQGKSYIQSLNLAFCELNLSEDAERVIDQIIAILETAKIYSNRINISLFSDIATFSWNIMILFIVLSSFWIVMELFLIFHSKIFTKVKNSNHIESDIPLNPFNDPRYIIK